MSEAVRWRLRPDLVWETIQSGNGLIHVVKDPVTGQFFHFDPREFSILKLLDGLRGPSEVLSAIRQSRPDELFSTDALLRFLAEARRNGLLLLRGGAAVDPQPRDASSRGWRVLAWKLPLVNPVPVLKFCRPAIERLVSWPAALAWLAVVSSALALAAGRFDDVTARLPAAQAWSTPSMLVTILATLAVCKIVHELAHAALADRCGVRVEECGVMLFYFVPCFYCDVSDAWLLRSPRQRILISAAGMLAELGLAALATWIWWFSHPGPVQSICLAVMVTCSINTLLINGNPLMRFDGYFVLVDLLGMPNLAPRAAAWWSAAWERVVFGMERAATGTRDDLTLAVYGAAAFAYRLLVLAGILWAIHQAFAPRGAGVFSAALAMVAAAGVLQGLGRATLRPLRDPQARRLLRPGRTAASLLVVCLLLGLAVFVPLPRSIEADIVIEPATSTAVFVQTPGVLRWLRPAGSLVQAGEVIVRLDDDATVRRLQELESQRAQAERRLESARVRRAFDPAASQEIPTLAEALVGIEERWLLAQATAAELEIKAPAAGQLLPPPNVVQPAAGSREAQFWHGTPFDAGNLGCTLRQGTCVAVVASPDQRCAIAYISQRRIERVRPGARVRLALDGRRSAVEQGVVVELSPAPVDELPRELVATHRVPLSEASAAGGVRPLEPMYRVRIELDRPELPAAIGMLGTARIRGEGASLARRAAEFLAETFRVDL